MILIGEPKMKNDLTTTLLEIVENELRISHRIIAEQTESKEKTISRLIRNHIDKLELFGRVGFEIHTSETAGGKQEIKTYYLNEQQATLLLTFMRNNEIVINFKVRLVKEFFQMREKLRAKKPKEDIDLDSIKKRAELLETSQKEFKIFEDVFYRIGITRPEELAITSNRAVAKETGVDFIELAELKGVSTPDRYFTVTELCQKVMNSDKFSKDFKKLVSTKKGDKPRPQNLNKLLETNGFQTKIDGIWKPTEKAKELADFVQNKSKHSEKTVFHTVWKMEVLDRII
jgi:phage regulator Rha-like protein